MKKQSKPARRRAATASAPTTERLLEGVLALGRSLHLDMDEQELASLALHTMADLLPGRALVLRVERDRDERLVVATPGARVHKAARGEPYAIKPSAVTKTRLDAAVISAGRVAVVESPPPVVTGAAAGVTIPLVAAGQLYGALDVAYARAGEAALADEDERVLIPIANQLAVALRNGRLHRESAFLRSYLEKVIDHAGALIIGADPAWRVTLFNRRLAELTGYTAEEMIGTDVRRWLPERERPRLVRMVLEAGAGESPEPIDVESETKDGRRVRAVWSVTAVAPHGKVEAVVAVGQDVTKLRSLERQVIQAEKLATLGQLAAGVVHELNNPLTQIMVYAEYLLKRLEAAPPGQRGPFGPGDEQKLRRILEGAERILSFSRELVQYARPSGSDVDVLSLNDVVREALAFCEHLVRRQQAEVSLVLADELRPIYAVRGQLQQVVINLITNAVHALDRPGGHVRVRTFAAGEAGEGRDPRLGLEVRDDGRGISARDLPRIFEPFFTTKTDGQGTGLGLSIVQGIIEGHRGTISVESTEGQGSRFTVILPCGHLAPGR